MADLGPSGLGIVKVQLNPKEGPGLAKTKPVVLPQKIGIGQRDLPKPNLIAKKRSPEQDVVLKCVLDMNADPHTRWKQIDERVVCDVEQMMQLNLDWTKKYWLLAPRYLLLLEGPLGSGKTTFVRGFSISLEITETINSPSFNLLNEFAGKNGYLYHYDLYRLALAEEIHESGFLDHWFGRTERNVDLPQIHAIEWWHKFAFLFYENWGADTLGFRLEFVDEQTDDPDSEQRVVKLYKYE